MFSDLEDEYIAQTDSSITDDQREEVSMLSEDENPWRMLYEEDKPDPMLIVSTEESDCKHSPLVPIRKKLPKWTHHQVKISPEAGLEVPHDDGFSWRKYGQKDILGTKFPRSYYRCPYRNIQNCWATKQVQRSDDDPTLFDIIYRGEHTCALGGPSALPAASESCHEIQIPGIHLQSGSIASSGEPHEQKQGRKALPRWTDQVQISPVGLEGPRDDGFSWRKYGQKDILGAKYPRGYYRCTYRNTQNCWATKQVQRSDDDPTVFEITYRGKHTCIHGGPSTQLPALPEEQEGEQINHGLHGGPSTPPPALPEEQDGKQINSGLHEGSSTPPPALPEQQDGKHINRGLHGGPSTPPPALPEEQDGKQINHGSHQQDPFHDTLTTAPRQNSDACMDHKETDSCSTDTDTEDATATRARRKHPKLMAPESCHEIQIPEIHNSSSRASSGEMFLPVEMPIDANIENNKTELSKGCDHMLSWELFHQTGGEEIHSAEIQAIAKQIVRACEGDSRSLTLMARALSNVSDIETWEYALDNLSLQHASCHDDSENLLVNVLRFSTEQLEEDVSRECLKSFALHSKNTEVARASLVGSWIGDGMIATHSEGEEVLKNLLDAKLLDLSENGELVKFLNIGRHVVDLIFQAEEGLEFLMQGGLGLVEPPEVGEWERAKEICLMHNDLSELPENPSCPSLSTLFLQRNHKLRTIPSSFFRNMPALEVLNLSRTRIKSLPDSLFGLVSLKRLFLNECILLRALSAKVGELKNLELLDLEGTKLMGLPREIQQLINLTCLEVSISGSRTQRLSKEVDPSIPSRVLSALSLLEELNIDVDPEAEWWDSYVKGVLDEICSLERLTALKFYFPKVELLRQFDPASLTHFRIVVGKHVGRIMSRFPPDIEFELERWDRYLKYINGEGVLEDVMKVMKQADAFFLDRHTDLKKLSDFGKGNLEQLRCCVLGECNEFQVLIDAENTHEEGDGIFLGSLEYLGVYYMKNLETIWRGSVQNGSLSFLKLLTLRTCPKLTSVFTLELLENLWNLEELTIEDCPALISIISWEHLVRYETTYYLPMLRKLSLHYLPELTNISSSLQVAPRIEWLTFYDCPNIKSVDLSIEQVKRIRGQRIWWDCLEWIGDRPGKLDDVFVAISEDAVL